jgi:hypothetical protein
MGRPWDLAQARKSEEQIELRRARLEEFEERIFVAAAQIVEAQLAFSEVAPNQEHPPAAWVEEYGEEGAKQRLLVAKSGWLPKSHAPAAADLAARVTVGIARARRHQLNVRNQQINVTMALPAPTSAEHSGETAYPRKRIE